MKLKLALILFMLFIGTVAIIKDLDFRKKCEAAGGEYIVAISEDLCLVQDARIPIF